MPICAHPVEAPTAWTERHTEDSMSRHLVAILHSQPLGDGRRTLQRVELARSSLSCTSYSVANLYPAPLADVNAMADFENRDTWQLGRDEVTRAVSRADTTDVLLGYGVQFPTGVNRRRFREQLDWLAEELAARPMRVWTFGGRPTHPSRWQRVVHQHKPGASVDELASVLLAPFALDRGNGR